METSPSFIESEELDLLFFGGKGGVGKTTCAAATALKKASQGKKTLIMSINPAHSLSDIFESSIGSKVTEIEDNLWGIEISAEELVDEYRRKNKANIRIIIDRGTYIDTESLDQLLDLSLPGVDEIICLLKLMDINKEGKYDLLILDTAATGHTIRLFSLPKLIDNFFDILKIMEEKYNYIRKTLTRSRKRGFSGVGRWLKEQKEDVKNLKSLIMSRRTEFVLITIPESMVIQETELLDDEIRKKKINVENIIINMVNQSEECAFCKTRKEEDEKYVLQIKSLFPNYKIIQVPLFPEGVKGMKYLAEFGKFLTADGHENRGSGIKDGERKGERWDTSEEYCRV